jgi:hypothetical protein
MATTYCFKGHGAALPYDAFGHAVLKRRINVANLVATDFGKLALAASPTVGLTSFTSFDGTAGDVLQIFRLPAGTLVKSMGIRIVTAGTASGTGALGTGASTAGFMAAQALDAAANTTKVTLVADAYGPDNVSGVVYSAIDTLDMLFAGAAVVTGTFDVWAEVMKVY